MADCIECGSSDTEWFIGDDDHFRKRCLECEHIGGPYVSRQLLDEDASEGSRGVAESVFDY